MKHMLKHFTVAAIVFALCTIAAPVFAVDISVGSATGAPGDQVVVPVYLNNNDVRIASLTVPLQFSNTYLNIDSVSYAGTLIKPNMSPLTHIDNPGQFLRITYIPSAGLPLIEDSQGLLANIYFTISPSSPDHIIYVDSVNSLTTIQSLDIWVRMEISDSLGESLVFPDFSAGTVEVRNPLDADDDEFGLPNVLALNQNYPNPFNPTTTISYSVPERAHVNLRIFNILGQEVQILVDNTKEAGQYEINWDAKNSASGIYFYRLSYQDKVLTKKMTLLK